MDRQQILNLEFEFNGELVTIRKYFHMLLLGLWNDKDLFDAKRPFGKSFWHTDIAPVLIKNNLVQGIIDQDGYVERMNNEQYDEFVLKNIINPLFQS